MRRLTELGEFAGDRRGEVDIELNLDVVGVGVQPERESITRPVLELGERPRDGPIRLRH